MENNYWIVDDLLIFKPKFNKILTEEDYTVINSYNKIIFSNYDEPFIPFDFIENKFIEKDKIIPNEFNNEIDFSNNPNLTHLFLGEYFDNNINL